VKQSGFSQANGRDAGIAAYGLMQALMVSLVDKGTISMTEGADIIERAGQTLRRRSEDFGRAAAILDQEAVFWRIVTVDH
jgi:hypothetical protein